MCLQGFNTKSHLILGVSGIRCAVVHVENKLRRCEIGVDMVGGNMNLGRNSRALKVAGAISLAVWVIANSVLWYHYAETRPRVRNPTAGHIYPLNTHGSVVYLTLTDCIILYGTLVSRIRSTVTICRSAAPGWQGARSEHIGNM
jgi:hypothetical protein